MTTILAYIGPETTLPLASAVVASVGVMLAFGRTIGNSVARIARSAFRERSKTETGDAGAKSS